MRPKALRFKHDVYAKVRLSFKEVPRSLTSANTTLGWYERNNNLS